MTAPRKADDLLADALGISRSAAAAMRRRMPPTAGHAEVDAAMRSTASLADLEAARSLTDYDLERSAEADDPLAELQATVDGRADRQIRAALAAHASWAKTEDPAARTRPAREAFDARFEREVDPMGRLAPEERQRRAAHARKAYFLRLALKSAAARKGKPK